MSDRATTIYTQFQSPCAAHELYGRLLVLIKASCASYSSKPSSFKVFAFSFLLSFAFLVPDGAQTHASFVLDQGHNAVRQRQPDLRGSSVSGRQQRETPCGVQTPQWRRLAVPGHLLYAQRPGLFFCFMLFVCAFCLCFFWGQMRVLFRWLTWLWRREQKKPSGIRVHTMRVFFSLFVFVPVCCICG